MVPSIEVLPTGSLKLYKSMQAFEFNPRGMIAASHGPEEGMHSYQISERDVRIQRQLGAGACGIVYKAWLPRLGRHAAVKKMSVLDRAHRHQLMNDVRTLCGAPAQEGLVGFLGAYHSADRGQVAVVLEYVDGGSLADLLARRPGRGVPEPVLASIAAGALRGLRALHARRVLHRDIKPANVLLTRQGAPRLADFGIAANVPDASLAACQTFTGTVTYMSPERVDGRPYSLPADIWALGLTLLEAVTGAYPYDASAGVMQLMVQVMQEDCPLPPAGAVSRECRDFLARCLAREPAARASADQLLAHPLGRQPAGQPVRGRLRRARRGREVAGRYTAAQLLERAVATARQRLGAGCALAVERVDWEDVAGTRDELRIAAHISVLGPVHAPAAAGTAAPARCLLHLRLEALGDQEADRAGLEGISVRGMDLGALLAPQTSSRGHGAPLRPPSPRR
ncbi:hypothetical protein QBZ16_000049 [Prototheca wickerhamii]|uniref:mitogen-activated protein kinase kinase n=1 Tax=Prototheca wickerhamii TaxID=3111 RepID=A0AAD9IKJ8_PROWI|nr:hypothetical protein QBZ16_000049 [Prototheca wickerhamii]